MKVILKQDVKTLGKKGNIVEVSEGYYRNFLCSKGLAVLADNKNISEMNSKNKAEEFKREKEKEAAMKIKENIEKGKIEFNIKVGENGKTFGSITEKDIAEKLKQVYNINIDKKKINMNEHIKQIGFTNVEIKIYEGVIACIKVEVKGIN